MTERDAFLAAVDLSGPATRGGRRPGMVAPPADDVRRHMTAVPVSVPRETPLFDLARCMSEAGVHRVVVTDDDRRPVGVVSSLDVASAVADLPEGG